MSTETEKCELCGETLYEGDTAYKLPDETILCPECIKSMKIKINE